MRSSGGGGGGEAALLLLLLPWRPWQGGAFPASCALCTSGSTAMADDQRCLPCGVALPWWVRAAAPVTVGPARAGRPQKSGSHCTARLRQTGCGIIGATFNLLPCPCARVARDLLRAESRCRGAAGMRGQAQRMRQIVLVLLLVSCSLAPCRGLRSRVEPVPAHVEQAGLGARRSVLTSAPTRPGLHSVPGCVPPTPQGPQGCMMAGRSCRHGHAKRWRARASNVADGRRDAMPPPPHACDAPPPPAPHLQSCGTTCRRRRTARV
jgi:hypothetical protein